MGRIKEQKNLMKITLLAIFIVTFIGTFFINVLATELEENFQFTSEGNANIRDAVGQIVQTYYASSGGYSLYTNYVITWSYFVNGVPPKSPHFSEYTNCYPHTALSQFHSIYCIEHGRDIFDYNEFNVNGNDSFSLSHCYLVTDHGYNYNKYHYCSLYGGGTAYSLDDAISFTYGGYPSNVYNLRYVDYKDEKDNWNESRVVKSSMRYRTYSNYTLNIVDAYAATLSLEPSITYYNDSQFAIWEKHGNNNDSRCNNALFKAAHATEDLDDEIRSRTDGENPKFEIMMENSSTGCGTTLINGNTFRVGPFKMNDYAYVYSSYAQQYSGKNLSTHKGLLGGIVDGYIVLNNGTKLSFENDISIYYRKIGDNNRGCNHGSYINGVYQSYNSWGPEPGYKYPWPNSEFYIDIPVSKCGDATTLVSSGFTYRKTKAYGNGFKAEGKFLTTTFQTTNKNLYNGCPTYRCEYCANQNIPRNQRSDVTTHTYYCSNQYPYNARYCYHGYQNCQHPTNGWDGGPYCGQMEHQHSSYYCYGYCYGAEGNYCYHGYRYGSNGSTVYHLQCTTPVHTHYSSCYNCGTGAYYCVHGHYDGVHSGSCLYGGNFQYSHIHECNRTTYCDHHHTSCNYFQWYVTNCVIGEPQELIGISSATVEVHENKMENTYNVRLTTDLQINKFITRVEHVGTSMAVFPKASGETATSRSRESKNVQGLTGGIRQPDGNHKTPAQKKADPVKVEKGDKITYYIDVYNNQDQKVKCKIEDIIPQGTDSATYNPSMNAWLTIEGNQAKTFIVTVRVTADGDKQGNTIYENCAKLITKNDGNVDYNRTVYDSATSYDPNNYRNNGRVVNVAEYKGGIIEDYDYHKIKQYHVGIEKYIYRVQHSAVVNGLDANSSQAKVFGPSEERKKTYATITDFNNNEKYKKDNPVYVENGDIVTFRIVVYNTMDDTSVFGVTDRKNQPYWEPDWVYVDIEDELPEKYRNLEVKVVSGGSTAISASGAPTSSDSGGTLKISGFQIRSGTTATLEVKVTVPEYEFDSNDIIRENNAKITGLKNINRGPNSTGVDKYCEVTNMNTCEALSSSDWYKLKSYSISVDKYITKTEHQSNLSGGSVLPTVLNSESDERSRRTLGNSSESVKENNPVYVEYGDRVYYKIVVYNTATEIGVNRTSLPYDSPDKVYVNLKDELPAKCSKIEIEVLPTGMTGDDSHTDNIASAVNGGTLEIENLMVPANGKREIIVSLTVEEHEKGTKVPNTVTLGEEIRNINRGPSKTGLEDKICRTYPNVDGTEESRDWYILNNYNTFTDKYIYEYNQEMQRRNNNQGFSNGGLVPEPLDPSRRTTASATGTYNSNGIAEEIYGAPNQDAERQAHPVSVEKNETIAYRIEIVNKSQDGTKGIPSGAKPATQVRATEIMDYMEEGIELEDIVGYKYDSSGRQTNIYRATFGIAGKETINGRVMNKYNLTLNAEDSILKPGESIIYEITARVTKSNMYLYDLENRAKITELTNINTRNLDESVTRIVKQKNGSYTEDISNQNDGSADYIRMKDLVIAGKVWVDFNRDGLMNDNPRPVTYGKDENTLYGVNGNAMKGNIPVKLYNAKTDELVRETKTDAEGFYTFGKTSTLGWRTEDYNYYNYNGGEYQRVDKATNKDSNGNYQANSELQEYYIEFEYDGVVFRSTANYAGRDNINNDGSYNDPYEIDSNAYEFTLGEKGRETFNKKYSFISYNKATGTTSADLSFFKTDHYSQLKEDPARKMFARTFIARNNTDDYKTSTDFLWLFPYDAGNYSKPETEHLKYINLGLELREDVDLTLLKDVYEVKTTINGEEMKYTYNQSGAINNLVNGEIGANGGEYFDDFTAKKPYGLELYESDYKYRFDQYLADAVRAYKTEGSELNIEVTFKISVTNRNVQDDALVPTSTDTPLDVKINEVLDLYDINFKPVGSDPVTVKGKDDNGLLTRDIVMQAGEAWYMNGDTKVDLAVNATSHYPSKDNDFTADGYNTSYIYLGDDGMLIHEGESQDIFVKYIIDKDSLRIDVDDKYDETTTKTIQTSSETYEDITMSITDVFTRTTSMLERSLKIAERPEGKLNSLGTENIAQLNAYSVWYTDGKPASIVDMDSNVGNIGVVDDNGTIGSADDTTYYEDTTYKTGIEIYAKGTENTIEDVRTRHPEFTITPPIRRTLSGMVWDDSRSDTAGTSDETQFTGNGRYDTSDSKQAEAQMNDNVELNYNNPNTRNNEEGDLKVRNAKAELIEIVETPNGHYYEEVLSNVTWDQIQHARTDEDGMYYLKGFIPGRYVVKFTYGDTINRTAFDATDEAQRDMLIFNGQDYKSTKYLNFASDSSAANVEHSPADVDRVMDALEMPGLSDARDDEVRRLQANAYSERMVNQKAEVLKGIANGTSLTNTSLGEININYYNGGTNTPAQLQELTDNTYMTAETPEFLVKTEKVPTAPVTYGNLKELVLSQIEARNFSIENIDMGIEYRPETAISLTKEVSNIQLVTSDNKLVVDLKLYTEEGPNGEIIHRIDTENSIGAKKVQFITNRYDQNALLRGVIVNDENKQGFIYVAVDNEILQGCRVIVQYKFTAQNNSEVDRVSAALNAIRFPNNPATQSLLATCNNAELVEEARTTLYTANRLAGDIVYDRFFSTEQNRTYNVPDRYRTIPKVMTNNGTDGYYGQFVGYTYYTGEVNNLDVIAEMKFDRIIDYVDTNLEFGQLTQTDTSLLGEVGTGTGAASALLDGDIRDQDFIGKQYWSNNSSQKVETLEEYLFKLNKPWADKPWVTNPIAGLLVEDFLTDLDGVKYKSLVMTVPDKYADNDEGNNSIFTKFLLPSSVNVDESKASAYLPVSKLLSSNEDTNNMAYENIAEVIQFTVLTGRRTHFDTTIGNADIHEVNDQIEAHNATATEPDEWNIREYGSIEFVTSGLETDTAATETITLAPPTGLMRSRVIIADAVDTTKNIVVISVVAIALVFAVLFVIKVTITKITKRRYK